MPLSIVEIAYQETQIKSEETKSQHLTSKDDDQYFSPIWVVSLSNNFDALDVVFPFDESIMESLNLVEQPWDINHHGSHLLPSEDNLKNIKVDLATDGNFQCYKSLISPQHAYAKVNMENISNTIPIYISKTPSVIENMYFIANCSPKEIETYTTLFKEFHGLFSWSYKEIPGIDLRIVQHGIQTYTNAKNVQQKIRVINPRKGATIKAEIEKLLKEGFIYPVS